METTAIVQSISQNNRLSTLQPKEVLNSLLLAVARAYADSGQKTPSDNELSRTVMAIEEDTRQHFPSITIAELQHVIARMIRGYYGEFTGISVANIHKAVRSYMESEERAEFIRMARDVNQKMLPSKADKTEYEKRQSLKDAAVKKYELHLNGLPWSDFGNPTYDFLDSLGMMSFTPERKKEFMNLAKNQLIAKKKGELHNTELYTPKADDLLRAIENIRNNTEKAKITAQAKRIALQIYFNELAFVGTDVGQFKEFIDEAINQL